MSWESDAKVLLQMLKPLDESGPVHPTVLTEPAVVCGGITKRELYAAMAMQGLIIADSNPAYLAEVIVSKAVNYSDALIAELSKPKEPEKEKAPLVSNVTPEQDICVHDWHRTKDTLGNPGYWLCEICGLAGSW